MTQCAADFEITQGDDAPPWISKLGDAYGDALDLTGATVEFFVWERIAGTPVELHGVAAVVDATHVHYLPEVADFADLAPGDYAAKWRVTFPTGAIESFPSDHQTVRVFVAPPT